MDRDRSNIVAGRDLEGGGTWMGITPNGRIAALTNYREPGIRMAAAPSRGHLVSDFLKGSDSLNHYLKILSSTSNQYNGFNILLSEDGRWVYYSNRGGAPHELQAGIHGLSNHLLNTPWPKVRRSCRAVENHLSVHRPPDTEDLLQVLQDRTVPPDADLPQTGVGLEWERRLGSVFIQQRHLRHPFFHRAAGGERRHGPHARTNLRPQWAHRRGRSRTPRCGMPTARCPPSGPVIEARGRS